MSLTRTEIFAVQDLHREQVYIPEWDGFVFVRTMTGTERDAFEAGMLKVQGEDIERNLANYRARLLTYCVVDETGAPIFLAEDDAKALGEKAIPALKKLFNVATRLNAMSESDVRELTANLKGGPSGSSISG